MRLTLLLGLLLLTACTTTATQTAVPQHRAAAAPSAPTGKGQMQDVVQPSEVRAALEAALPAARPILLPTWLPQPDLEARVSFDRGFQVSYWAPSATTWSVAIGVGGGPDPARLLEKPSRTFRGAPAIYLHGEDRPDHISLLWGEPTTNGPLNYGISAYGLSDEEFTRLSTSLSDQ